MTTESARRRNVSRMNVAHDGRIRELAPEALTCHNLAQYDPCRKHVSTPVQGRPDDLFRCHVTQFPLDGTGSGMCLGSRDLCDSEIQHFHRTVVGHEDILRGEIAM